MSHVVKRCALLVIVFLVAAQTRAHDPSPAQREAESDLLRQLDGSRWSVEYISATPELTDDNQCSNGRGITRFIENVVTGTMVGTNRRTYRISGELRNDGTIEGGLAISKVSVARFTGTQAVDHGVGTWEVRDGCRGTWASSPLPADDPGGQREVPE